MSQHKKETHSQAGQYDKIWRENMHAAMPGLIRRVRYNLISISDISYKLFLSSDVPEENMLAVLGDFHEEQPEMVLSAVIDKVQQSAEGDFSANRYMHQLRLMIQLRNLVNHLDKAMEKVSTFFKEEKDPFFQRGKKIGVELGREEGIEHKNLEFVRNLVTQTTHSDEQIANLVGVSVEFVREIRASLTK